MFFFVSAVTITTTAAAAAVAAADAMRIYRYKLHYAVRSILSLLVIHDVIFHVSLSIYHLAWLNMCVFLSRLCVISIIIWNGSTIYFQYYMIIMHPLAPYNEI